MFGKAVLKLCALFNITWEILKKKSYLEANNYVLIYKVGWENWGKVVKKLKTCLVSNFRFKKRVFFMPKLFQFSGLIMLS